MALVKPYQPSWTIPIQTLPNEILASIFTEGAARPTSFQEYRDIPFPCIVSSVNCHWREVALRLPIIWTTVVISDDRPLNLPTLCLQRSGDMQIHAFVFISNLGGCDFKTISSLLDSRYVHELSVTIDAAFTCPRGQFFRIGSIINSCVVHLKHLEFTFSGHSCGVTGVASYCDWVATIVFAIFMAAKRSNLQSLRFDGAGIFNSPSLLTIIQTRGYIPLTTLYLKLDSRNSRPMNAGWPAFKVFLSSCTNLQELVLEGNDFSLPDDARPENVICLESLRSLALRWSRRFHSGRLASFVRCIETPALTYLELVDAIGRALNIFALRSNPTMFSVLHTLRITGCRSGREPLSDNFYQLFSSVRELQLAKSDGHYFLPAARLHREGAPLVPPHAPLWPTLEVLSYDGSDFNWLRDVVRSRSCLGSQLQAVRIIGNHFSRDNLEWLKEHVTVERMVDSDHGLLSARADIEDLDMRLISALQEGASLEYV